MNIMSLDPSLTGSFTFIGTEKKFDKYVYFSDNIKDIKNKNCIKISKDMSSVYKLDLVVDTIEKLCIDNDIDYMFMEAPSYSSMNSCNEFKYVYGLIQYKLRKLAIPYILVPPISLKLFFTGIAKADKKQMIEQAKKEFNRIDYDLVSKKHCEDLADALGLYEIGISYMSCIKDIKNIKKLPLHRQQVIAKILGKDSLYKEIVKERSKKK